MWCYLVLLGVIGRDPLRRKRYILHTHRKKSYLILELEISITEKDILRRERSPPQRKISFAEKDLLRSDRTGPQCIVPHLNARSSRINTLRYNFFTSMGPRLFNSLPKAVKECSSPDSFKRTLDKYIMSLPDTPPTPSYVTANNNSILDWAVTSSRTLPEELS